MDFVRAQRAAVVWSVILHVTGAMALGLTFRVPTHRAMPAAATPIQGVVVDASVLERVVEQRQEAARRERQRVQREERQRQEAVEREKLAAQRAERERREEADKKERERVAAERREQERREQQARERREREEAAKKEREAAVQRARQQQAERELQDALAAEREQQQAVAAGLLDQYMFMIESRVKQYWSRPLSARSGIDCVVNVTQLPTGDVLDARVGSCNGDDTVRRSIEKAVRDASPLPRAPSTAVFSRTFTIRFRPDE